MPPSNNRPTEAEKKANIFRALMWITCTLLSFLTMAIAARELSDTLNPVQIVFLRTSVGMAFIVGLVLYKGTGFITTQRLPFHIFRNVVHYGANTAWIMGVGLIPLAQVFALEFSIPIWVAILAVLFLKEKMTFGKIVAISLGFTGVLIILRPGMVAIEAGSIAVLIASMGFAISNVCTKSMAHSDAPLVTLVLMFIIQWPLSAVGAIFAWQTPEWADAPWILLVGATALSAHYTMTRALQLADATVILPIDFARMPMIAVIGFFFYAEPFSGWIFLGAALIFGGNYFNIYRERRKS